MSEMKHLACSLILAAVFFAPNICADERTSQAATKKLLQRGQSIYAAACAECHGNRGQGVKDAYADELAGDLSLQELRDLIDKTMPEGEPEKCAGEDARAVATYVFDAFYSEAARIRNHPPSIRLTHLTGSQLRQSLADVYSHFAGIAAPDDKRGLSAVYFKGARPNNKNKTIERVDPRLDFDWKLDGPGSGIDGKDFFVRWKGGLLVEETGRYEIVINSTCAFICNLGRYDREFINNRVQSGDKTEFRKSVMLTGGRVYPVQIDLYQRKRKTAQPPAKISLAWVAPHQSERIIPARSLVPNFVPATFSLQTKLPPDDRSYGYELGLSVDRQWDAATTSAAAEFARAASLELWKDYSRKNAKVPTANRERLKQFLVEIISTAFRGPLDEATRRFYIDEQIAHAPDDVEAIKRCLLVALKSPRFQYPGLDSDRSVSQRRANRLALTLFDSLPADMWLTKAAEADKLQTSQQVRIAADRMVDDFRTRGKTRELLYEWLNLRHISDIAKSAEDFPKYNADIVTDSKASLDAFLDEVVWSEQSDFQQLLLADWAFTTPRLAEYYGASWKPAGEPAPADDDSNLSHLVKTASGDEHVGVLSHPYMMSGLAYQDSTSPIHRGVYLIRFVLGRTLRPPKEAFTPLNPKLHPNLTTRQRIELQTSPAACRGCHTKINGLGFALENFDAVGRFRKQEGQKLVDTTGRYVSRDGTQATFKGANELAGFLAKSDDVHRAFVKRTFLHFVKQPIAAYGLDRLNQLTRQFRDNRFNIRKLLVEIAMVAATEQPKNNSSAEVSKK